MWFEVLPSYMICTVAMTIPAYAIWGLHKLFTGNGFRRNLECRFDRQMYIRDGLLSGDPYKPLGLENIPDEDDSSSASASK